MADEVIPQLKRLPRSLEESSSYYPDWRMRQVLQYNALEGAERAAHGRGFQLPDWEDDEEVHRYFAYTTQGVSFDIADTKRFFYADEAIQHNYRTGAAARIRCLLIAGATPDFVAKRLGTRKEHIETFYRLYFDIDRCLDNKDFMASLVFPFVVPRSEPPEQKKERLWRTGAFLMDIPGFDAISQKRIDMNAADIEKMNGQLKSLMYSQGLEYCLHRRAGMLPGPGDLDNVLAHMQIPATGDSERDSQSSIFTSSLVQVAAEKYNLTTTTKITDIQVVSTRIGPATSYAIQDIDYFAGDEEINQLGLLTDEYR